MTDSVGRAVVIGSACRCTIFQTPSSGAMISVTRKLLGLTASCPTNLALARSILTSYASSGITWLVMVSASTISPSRTCEAAWSITAATCSHPRAKGPRAFPRVTSCRRENQFFTGSGFRSGTHLSPGCIARSIPQRLLPQSSRPLSFLLAAGRVPEEAPGSFRSLLTGELATLCRSCHAHQALSSFRESSGPSVGVTSSTGG